ncbi:unnamed protein product [Bursaphelenchus xylophilus]|uniref:(pine wood nematode) hypothetical protein n=1 Tax=Bursaphelenchus xylophilus TaxID=6326 RepID=A0A7I8WPH1_BURXY|nr:unnamed protein product [Bursaphelenchus xylophilus]CAG9095081.1 unnamed protein product [Bursaphelenchus xylophilus]
MKALTIVPLLLLVSHGEELQLFVKPKPEVCLGCAEVFELLNEVIPDVGHVSKGEFKAHIDFACKTLSSKGDHKYKDVCKFVKKNQAYILRHLKKVGKIDDKETCHTFLRCTFDDATTQPPITHPTRPVTDSGRTSHRLPAVLHRNLGLLESPGLHALGLPTDLGQHMNPGLHALGLPTDLGQHMNPGLHALGLPTDLGQHMNPGLHALGLPTDLSQHMNPGLHALGLPTNLGPHVSLGLTAHGQLTDLGPHMSPGLPVLGQPTDLGQLVSPGLPVLGQLMSPGDQLRVGHGDQPPEVLLELRGKLLAVWKTHPFRRATHPAFQAEVGQTPLEAAAESKALPLHPRSAPRDSLLPDHVPQPLPRSLRRSSASKPSKSDFWFER